ncbi:MAG: DUF5658 family protein [Oligoflexia bacterium]|nr:DUF5658 family protein [Oligoflexia bacterium]
MAQAALKISKLPPTRLYAIEGGKAPVVQNATGIKAEIIHVGFLIALLQVMDGFLTYVGVKTFGLQAEGNALIRLLMEAMGPDAALVVVKSIALMVVAALCVLAHRVHWLTRAMKLVAAVYLCAAVLPWSYILIMRYSHGG